MVISFTFTPAVHGSLRLPMLLSTLVIVSLFIFSHSDRCEVLFHYSFNFHFVITKEVEHFFMWLVIIGYSFGEVPVQLPCPFFHCVNIFLTDL